MTLFEYLAAGHVLILSFAAVRILNVLPHAVRPSCQYWVHLSWLSLAIGLCIVSFWGFWSFRELEWTFPLFIAVLSQATLVYVFSTLIVPSEPSSVESWRDYFFEVRVSLLSTGATLMGSALLGNQLIHGISPVDGYS